MTNSDLIMGPLIAGKPSFVKLHGPQPVTVRFKCYVSHPPGPAVYEECDACQIFSQLKPGDVFRFKVPSIFKENGGHLIVEMTSPQGEKKEVQFKVSPPETPFNFNTLER